MVMPALPVAAFIVVQAEFFFELVVILLDLPAAFDESHDASQGVVCGKIA